MSGSSYVYQLEKEGVRLIVTGFKRDGKVRVSIRVNESVVFLSEEDALAVAKSLLDAVIRSRGGGPPAKGKAGQAGQGGPKEGGGVAQQPKRIG